MRCIYCLTEKDPTHFRGREHVTQQAFGVFDTNNLVLKCVCDDCNLQIGKTIDMKLARDAIEAVARVQDGVLPAAEYKHLGGRSTSYVEIMEGPLAGWRGFNVANAGGSDIGIEPFPQVSIGRSEDGPFEVFRVDLDEVPTKEELVAKGFVRGDTLFIRSRGVDDLPALLTSKGFNVDGLVFASSDSLSGRRFYSETVTRVSHDEFRAVTKVALNYLAAVVGAQQARLPEFDSARNYVLHGLERGRVRVYAYENRWFLGRRGHYVSLTRVDDMIVAQLSILLRVQYFVVLAENAADMPFKSSAHFFDLDARRISEIEPLPPIPGRPLKAID